MKVIVTGAKGQLGTDLVWMLESNGYEVFGYGREDLDITNINQVNEVFINITPDVVIHAAAHTKVDLAESEPDHAFLVNAIGTRNVSVAAEKINAKLVYVSTDYVFDGTASDPINEFKLSNPLGVYGESKLAGEKFVRNFHSKFYIVRTSWVYGKYGNNFVKTMLKLGEEKKELSVVDDQIGAPTYTVDLAERIIDLIQTEKYGVYHISNSGQCSWFEFAKAIFEESAIDVKVVPCTTKDFPRPAPRPSYSVLDHMGLRLNGFKEMPFWRDSLKKFLMTSN
ncbi:dTDP-4-dehydrorhamnose reductase [Bacillus sp. DTU_2020_1000418_1_SI_GHA_SEK_038]|uniref:dTDP-4-dehydrorhamnose reductase n=1 Tax=Bacillus sp. DTU_2020_1000418_1_SI_GHA_SEK_038 TaxID=3077585 RepID=UPI0028E94554|nr:dTDP-4-dehydrorhamnose reductase [Bacillus sp. DTU_2020_1000418_1_SI_GHA_SEK_038]WNS75201.1 dTDP-4-dehydrorhamnose reductase [Bacillus sp. DTU_2020_1000418_1_SI_GHA_SEK_038]